MTAIIGYAVVASVARGVTLHSLTLVPIAMTIGEEGEGDDLTPTQVCLQAEEDVKEAVAVI